MSRVRVAASLFLATSSVLSFQNSPPQIINHARGVAKSRQEISMLQRRVSASSSNPEFSGGVEQIGDALNSVTNAARDTINEAVSDAPDAEEVIIAEKQRLVGERVKTYLVTLPLASTSIEDKSEVLSIGLTLSQISKGRMIESTVLDLDTLEFQESRDLKNRENVKQMDESSLTKRVDGEFQGLVVSSVVEGSSAWVAGVRAGDILRTTSATLGSQLWPKSTLEGVRSAISSRRAAAGSIQMEFQRLGEAVDNQFELTLARPIGLELKETEDGYVEVTGFTQNAPTLVQYAVKVGDRVLAVDSSLGDRMWPVSTVEGVISAVTSRLPGQQITFRFERPTANLESSVVEPMARIVTSEAGASATTKPPIQQYELLERCRGVIKRYMVDEQASDKFVNKYAVPGLVADKVIDALASANAKVDRVTLSMIMGAYLSCNQAQKAIDAFEGVVGLRADGLIGEPTFVVEGKDGSKIIPNLDALDVYTASALLKAHAMKGDLSTVKRVLAAVEGRSVNDLDSSETASWPGTGPGGVLSPDARCYNIAMSAAVDSGTEDGFLLALELFNRMTEPNKRSSRGLEKNLVSYNIIINALASKQRFDDAIDLFYKMMKSGVKPDKFSYTSLVKAIAETGDIMELIYDMREQGVTPDAVTFNTIIKTLCKQRKLVAAKKVVNLMEGSGVAPDSMTYGLLMKGLLESGNPSAVLTLFESACVDQRTVSLTENVYLYTTAITAAASLGDHERALELLSRMTAAGVKPTLKTMTALVGACLASGKADIALEVYRRIPNPDGYAVSQGLRAMCEAGNSEEAISILSDSDIPVAGKQLMFTYKSMIESALLRHDYSVARRLLSTLLKQRKIPSKAIYQAIFESMGIFSKKRKGLNTLVREDEYSREKFQFLLFVLDSVSKRNIPCEGNLYSAVISYGLRLGGLPKKVASLLVSAKALGEDDTKKKIIDESDIQTTSSLLEWEELFLKYDELKQTISGPQDLPALKVRIAGRDLPYILKAEQGLSYRKKARDSRKLAIQV